jgi:hypothetical protein
MNDALHDKAPRPVGEVVVASTTEFVTQCHALYEAPPLGSLVRCGADSRIYAVVGDVTTQGIDPGRRPMALGEDEDSEEAVYRRNPQLSRLLSTEFRSIAVGHRDDGRLLRYLAPTPPRIHSFVYRCEDDETLEFTASMDFLPTLLASTIGSPDDVIAAFLRLAGRCHPEPESFLVDAGRQIAVLLAGQLQRLNGILRRLSP